jgi:hypothetical protein
MKEFSMKKMLFGMTCISAFALFSGCATPPRVAQNKAVEISGKKLDFGGSYAPDGKELTLTVNGDPIMRGRFPPYTTNLHLNGKYQNLDINASCSFGTVLSSMGGMTGMIAGAVQAGIGKGGDKCDLSVNDKPAETLFF